jgi:phage terminase small subunit
MRRRGELTEREKRFILAYVKEPNGTKAAIAAGYSPKTAKVQASRLLTRPNVKAELEKWRMKVEEHTEIDSVFVLQQSVEVFERCMGEVEPVTNNKGKTINSEDGRPLFKFNAQGAMRALETIGKHVRVQAFVKPTKIRTSSNESSGSQFFHNTMEQFISDTVLHQRRKAD